MAPHHVTTSIAIVANYCPQLQPLCSWLWRHSNLDDKNHSELQHVDNYNYFHQVKLYLVVPLHYHE